MDVKSSFDIYLSERDLTQLKSVGQLSIELPCQTDKIVLRLANGQDNK